MMNFIENLPANSKLYRNSSGDLTILGEEGGQHVAYSIAHRKFLLDIDLAVSKVRTANGYSETTLPTWVEARNVRLDLIDQLTEGSEIDKELQTEIWRWMNPDIDECYIPGISLIAGIEAQCELASFIVRAKQDDGKRLAPIKRYCLQYWVLVLSELKSSGLIKSGGYWGGDISTMILAQILGVKKLTEGMKRFIRLVRPSSISSYRDLMSFCLSKWDMLCPKFSHISQEIDEYSVRSFINNIAVFPSLLKAKWYTADILIRGNSVSRYEYEIREALRYVQAISSADVSEDSFLLSYIRSAEHLNEVIKCANAYFALNADSYCKALYPDDLAFPESMLEFEEVPFKHINTVGELRRCAGMLENCSVSYLEDVLNGESYLFFYESSGGEVGMLEIRSAGVKAMINRGTRPECHDFKNGSIIRQFVGYKNCKMSDEAWSWLEVGIQASVLDMLDKIPNFPKWG